MKLVPVRFGSSGPSISVGSSYVVLHSCEGKDVVWDDLYLSIFPQTASTTVVVNLRINGVSWNMSANAPTIPFRLDRFRLFPGQTLELQSPSGTLVTAIGNVLRAIK